MPLQDCIPLTEAPALLSGQDNEPDLASIYNLLHEPENIPALSRTDSAYIIAPSPPKWEYPLGFHRQLLAIHQAWSKDFGFLIPTKKTDKKKHIVLEDQATGLQHPKRVFLHCSRSGKYKPHSKANLAEPTQPGDQPKEPKTRKTDCPFLLKYYWHRDTQVFDLHETSVLRHTHPPDDLACFHQYRRLVGDMRQYAIDLINRMSPGFALSCLQSKYGTRCLATKEDICNLQQRVWREERRGMRSTEAMLTVLKSVNMSARYWLDPKTAELLGVLISDPLAIILAQK